MSIQLQEIENFLGEEECLQIIKMIDANNAPSLVATSYNHGETNDFRTSSTSNLDGNNLLVRGLHQKIADQLGLEMARGESLQGQVYETGQYFKPHTDYFEGDHYQQHCQASGNRTHTLMIYLNDVPEGGQTDFAQIGKTVVPKLGKAVIWRNMDDEGNTLYDSLHEGTPPTQGKKYVITSWWREKNWQGGEDARLATEWTAAQNPQIDAQIDDSKVIKLKISKPEEVVDVEIPETVEVIETPQIGETKPLNDLISLLGFEDIQRKVFSNQSNFPTFHPKGFEVVQVPEEIMGFINDAYNIMKLRGGETEDWDGLRGVMGGEQMPEMFSFDHIPTIKNFIHEMLRGIHEAWSNQPLEPTMMYGIRSYVNGSTLVTHTDRLDTHHISCIIIVDKDLNGEEDWPLQIQAHDGTWTEVYAEPGQMIIYESVACEHGRPTPFQGNYFRNFYAHYKLAEYTQI